MADLTLATSAREAIPDLPVAHRADRTLLALDLGTTTGWALHGADGLKGAVERIRADYPDVEVEVEVDKLDELREALKAEPEWILLDNMKPATLKKCVEINAGRSRLEASGGINLDTVADVAATGVDAISVGALTHSAVAVDLAMDFVKSMESVRGGVSV